MDAGLGGVVAMRYNLYVVTAAKFVAHLYAALAEGASLGEAATAGRRMLAADPHRKVTLAAHRLDDWLVPVVYEAEPVQLLRPGAPADRAGPAGAGVVVDAGLPAEPDAGFYGRDETLLALDRAFDTPHRRAVARLGRGGQDRRGGGVRPLARPHQRARRGRAGAVHRVHLPPNPGPSARPARRGRRGAVLAGAG
jgi:hypothetical protein